MVNAGKYNKKITIYRVEVSEDEQGFPIETKTIVLQTYSHVKTTKGMTLIINNSDFEKAYTNFTIRYPKTVINRKMLVDYKSKTYTIEYLNNVDESSVELEMQCKEVTP